MSYIVFPFVYTITKSVPKIATFNICMFFRVLMFSVFVYTTANGVPKIAYTEKIM